MGFLVRVGVKEAGFRFLGYGQGIWLVFRCRDWPRDWVLGLRLGSGVRARFFRLVCS